MRWTPFLVLPMTMLLTACDQEPTEVVVKTVCPTIMQYDQETQNRALAEYDALPKGSAIRLFVGDYKRLRKQIEVCRERAGAGAK